MSECLGFGAVRYNGQLLRSRFVEALREHVEFIHVCPEVGIGLGVPRDPVRLVDDKGRLRMVQPATDRDLTDDMARFASEFVAELGTEVDGFVLKSRSPTCGIQGVKVYGSSGPGAPTGSGTGLFAAAARESAPWAAIEDEGRLTNLQIRHHFLAAIHTNARFRMARAEGTMASLVRFHTAHKLLVMGHDELRMRELGRIVGNAEGRPPEAVFEAYALDLADALRRPPRVGPTVNVLQHAFGFVSEGLGPEERRYFLELLEEYRVERVPLAALLAVLRAWIVRQNHPWLEEQRFFNPYPRALLDLTDSGLRSRV